MRDCSVKPVLPVAFVVICLIALSVGQTNRNDIPPERRDALAKRLSKYVTANRSRNWTSLYDLVSETGRGGVDRKFFVQRMNEKHGRSFSNHPDLQEFTLARASAEDTGYGLYGCGKARREGQSFQGIIVIRAVYENGDWFFTGWRFDGTANGKCESLEAPDWKPKLRLRWDDQMEELRGE